MAKKADETIVVATEHVYVDKWSKELAKANQAAMAEASRNDARILAEKQARERQAYAEASAAIRRHNDANLRMKREAARVEVEIARSAQREIARIKAESSLLSDVTMLGIRNSARDARSGSAASLIASMRSSMGGTAMPSSLSAISASLPSGGGGAGFGVSNAVLNARVQLANEASKAQEKANRIIDAGNRKHREAAVAAREHGGAMQWLERRVASLGVAMGVAFAVDRLKDFTVDLVKSNRELQTAQIGVAGILFASSRGGGLKEGFASFAEAQRRAVGLYREMEIEAARTLGTTKEYLDVWQFIANPVLNAKGGLKEIFELTKLTVAVSKSLGMETAHAMMSVNQMLRGEIDARDRLAAAFNLTSKQINEFRENTPLALKLVTQKLREFSVVAEAGASTFEAQWSAMEDVVQQFKRSMGEPLFKALTAKLQEWTTYFQTHREEVLQTATAWGTDLLNGVTAVYNTLSLIKTIAGPATDALSIFLGTVVVTKLVGIASAFGEIALSVGGVTAAFGTLSAALAANPIGVLAFIVSAGLVGGLKLNDYLNESSASKHREEMAAWKTANASYFGVSPERQDAFSRVYAQGLVEFPDIMQERAAQYRSAHQGYADAGITASPLAMDLESTRWYQEAMVSNIDYLTALREGTEVIKLADTEYAKTLSSLQSFAGALDQTSSTMAAWDANFAVWLSGRIRTQLTTDYSDGRDLLSPTDDPVKHDFSDDMSWVNDFRGSHFEIKVDARHQDPDRVAAAIINVVGKQGLNRSQARTSRPHMTAR